MPPNVKQTLDGQPEPPKLAKFTVVEGRAKGRRYKVDEAATIGRSPEATIMLEDPEISRLHARVVKTTDGRFEIFDLDSRNGTFVNGEPVTRRTLVFGDRLRLGPSTVLEFYAFDATEELIIQRQRFESIGRLGVGIAHDLNNLIATLDASTSYLLDLETSTPMGQAEVRECLADMSLGAARAAELTRAILAFVRGRGHAYHPVDISALLRELARMLRRTLDRRITIHLDIEDDVVVHGSQSELHQVLLNLCLNARDAMPLGGQLTLSAKVVPPSTAFASSPRALPTTCITVSDTGHGMDSSTAARIFEPFFTTKQAGLGYGLGLATVREIVTVHGGRVSVESAVGQGTTFILQLPAMLPEPSDSIPTATTCSTATMRPPSLFSVLLVDDEAIVRRALARRLRQTGFVVVEAASGKEAIVNYREQPTHLVLLDLDMPDLDGEETHRLLSAIDPQVRVAYVTGYVESRRAEELRRLGAVAVLEKPVNINSLLSLANTAALPHAPQLDDFFDEHETLV